MIWEIQSIDFVFYCEMVLPSVAQNLIFELPVSETASILHFIKNVHQ